MQQHIQRRLMKQMDAYSIYDNSHLGYVIYYKAPPKILTQLQNFICTQYSHKEQKTFSPSNRQFNMFFFPYHTLSLIYIFFFHPSFQQQTTNVNYGIPICLCPHPVKTSSSIYVILLVQFVSVRSVFNSLNFLCLALHY